MNSVTLHAPFGGWLTDLSRVPDPVFGTGMMGPGVAIDPLDGTLRAPADAEVVSVPDSAHAITLRLVNGAELLIHIGLETVALHGKGFVAKVRAGDRVVRGDPLILVDLSLVAREAADLVTPIVLPGDGAMIVPLALDRRVAAGEPIATVTYKATRADAHTGPVTSRDIVVVAPQGIHARPASRIVDLLKRYAADVTIVCGERQAAGNSTVALLALGAKAADTLSVAARGRDADAAVEALASFAAERFGDPDGPLSIASIPRREGGVCAVPGIAIGQIYHYRPGPVTIDQHSRGAHVEAAALDGALQAVAAQLGGGMGAELAAAHRALLADPQLRSDADTAIAQGASAGTAWARAIATAADTLRATGDARLGERVADLHDIERQVLVALGGHAAEAAPIPLDAIVVAEDLLPSQFLALERSRLAGICTAAGGPTAHVAILAAAAGVPMIVAAGSVVLNVPDGSSAILDADAARLTIAPDPEVLAAASAARAASSERRTAERRAAEEPAVTVDGTRIEVVANLGSAADAAFAVAAGAEGCGLLRTEFLFLDRDDAPSEEEQTATYREIATILGDRPLIVRTLDVGADKPLAYLPQPVEENPALGQRGIRLSLARPDLFAQQLRAILAAVPAAQCRIMLPMITDVAELHVARAALDSAATALGLRNRVELGVMIETPAAAVLADQLAEVADFLSIGTNDLTQYVLAADRGNAAVAPMIDALHPAVLRLIRLAADGAATHGRWCGVCGGLASDPQAAALLIGLGVTELSAVPSAVAAVKAAVRRTDMAAAKALATRALSTTSAGEVRAMLRIGA
ncbi:phosphoenolpyruvate--protein phosphotransferase [Sphingomonas sp. Mn802worker]|uniref:phosphoenolpyruvate--protein phosphotransferase n=1 Tax=Sphingomonas sp. Mn802worker TaxID=629773 RepID=UPI00037B7E81|nr:phosphoenolpyruvate--protein phosphotransferase [Sphingomonas sp. Mn802worker]